MSENSNTYPFARPIGDIFTINGVKYVVSAINNTDDPCQHCALQTECDSSISHFRISGKCSDHTRNDQTDVVFKLYEDTAKDDADKEIEIDGTWYEHVEWNICKNCDFIDKCKRLMGGADKPCLPRMMLKRIAKPTSNILNSASDKTAPINIVSNEPTNNQREMETRLVMSVPEKNTYPHMVQEVREDSANNGAIILRVTEELGMILRRATTIDELSLHVGDAYEFDTHPETITKYIPLPSGSELTLIQPYRIC